MKVNANQFEKISIRGCVAYGICCFENALEHYNAKGEGWNYLLKKLWWYTELSAACDPRINNSLPLERWAGLIGEISPDRIKKYPTYAEFSAPKRWWFEDNVPSEQEYNMLNEAYRHTNSVIDDIYTFLLQVGITDLWCGIGKISLDTLISLQNIIDIMYQNEIPLPSIEPFKQYVFHKDGWDYDLHAYGETFDGTQYSKFVNGTK